PMKGLAAQELLSDLALELDAVRAMLRHGLPSFESPAQRSIPACPTVRPKGPTPTSGENCSATHKRVMRLVLLDLRSEMPSLVGTKQPGRRKPTASPSRCMY